MVDPMSEGERRRITSRVRRYAWCFFGVWTAVCLGAAGWVVLGAREFRMAHGLVAAACVWGLGIVAVALSNQRIRRGERRIEASEAVFRAIWEQSRDALFLMQGGRFLASNPAAAEVFQTDPDDLVGKPPWEFSPPTQPDGRSSREAAEERIRRALDGEPQLFEWRHRTAEGVDVDCEVALGRVEVGEEAYVLAAVRDISRRRMEEATRRLLERAVEAAAESVLITDPEGNILYVNAAFERVTGYSAEEVLGQNPRILKSGEHPESFYRTLWETITSGRVWRGTFTNRKKGGELYREEAVIAPVTDERGAISAFVAVRRDVTREEELERRLRLAERMETVGQMASVVAHDFNNLLGAVQGAAELIRMRAGSDEGVAARVASLEHVVDRGAALVKRLLAVSKREIRRPEDLDLGAALEEMRPTLRDLLREDIRFDLLLPGGRLVSRADPAQLEQVMLNLAANARDAMPRGGELTIELDSVDLDETYLAAYPDVEPGRFARISVTDTGEGMDRETVQHIFEPFYSTKGEHGTGLGLATVYGIVQSSGGLVNVYSEPGRGTTFKVYLPLVEGGSPSGRRRVELDRDEDLPGGEGTVLVVEDDPLVLESVCELIRELGYSVIPVESGAEALRVLQERPLEVDLIFTDVVLPGLDGGELASRAGELAPHAGIVFTSGYTENVVHDRFVSCPGVFFLEKPYSFARLAWALHDASRGREQGPGTGTSED